MNTFDYANGAAVALAVVCSIGIVGRSAKVLAAVLVVNWLHFVLSYQPRPPVALLWDMGVPLESHVLWSLLDATLALTGLMCWKWWGTAIYILALTQVVMHGLYWDVALLPSAIYYKGLDSLFLAQVAVFILAGGGGIASRIGRFLNRSRNIHRTSPSAHIRTG